MARERLGESLYEVIRIMKTRASGQFVGSPSPEREAEIKRESSYREMDGEKPPSGPALTQPTEALEEALLSWVMMTDQLRPRASGR